MTNNIKARLARLESETPAMVEIVIHGGLPEAGRTLMARIHGGKVSGEGHAIEGRPGESYADFRARVRAIAAGNGGFLIFGGLPH